ncbi:MAG: hypothetical protein H7Y38_13275 [Armatimonadetes bacterium]|nr:hypothetical protein [Armatimonadota bacterium]
MQNAPHFSPPITAQVRADGSVLLENMPFAPGHFVQVTVAPLPPPMETVPALSLVGALLRYDDPFAPATDPDDWNAMRNE